MSRESERQASESEKIVGELTRREDSRERRGGCERKKNRWKKAGRRALICRDFNCLDPQ